MEESSIDVLPEDMLIEILSRLSVKTLIRLTCVCKQWLSLIRSPSFAIKQLATVRSKLFKDNFQFFFTPRRWRYPEGGICRHFASLHSYDSFELYAKFEWSPCYNTFFSNSCDGIICVFVRRDGEADYPEEALILWNPSTREVEVLPFPLPPCFTDFPPEAEYRRYHRYHFGFGYDPKSDDYKIFVILKPSLCLAADGDWPVEVYSLRGNSWKFLPANSFNKSFRSICPVYDCPKLCGVMCNWMNESWWGADALISFDLTDEKFLKTPLHEHCIHPRHRPVLLQSNKVDTRSRVMCSHYSSCCPDHGIDFEIWELMEYGGIGCWSKQIVIEFQDYPTVLGPLGYWQNEEILILQQFESEDGHHLIGFPLLTYNPDTKQLKSTGFEGTLDFSCGYAYIESLISVKGRRREHEALEHQQLLNDSGLLCTLHEVHGPVASRSSFPCSSIPWLD